MKVWEKGSNIIKNTFNSDLYIIKNIQKLKKKINTKESFQYFYIPVILIDSVY